MTTNKNAQEQSLGEELLRMGWRQGALFSAPSISFTYHDLLPSATPSLTEVQKRGLKSKEKLIVISQDCDIKANKDQEPYIEAIICKPSDQKFIVKIGRLSARWFLVDAKARLVAEARYKIQIAKRVFLQLQPELWPGNANERDEFIRWVARRYDRPAFPDQIVEAFQKPIVQKMASAKDEHVVLFAAFNDAVHELRVSLPKSEEPPFDLQLIFLVRVGDLTNKEQESIKYVKELLLASVDSNIVHLNHEIPSITEKEMSLADYRASHHLYFDYYTYSGGEIEGAEPYRRA